MGSSLTSYIHKGDILITDGKYILTYASAQDMYTKLRNGDNVSKFVQGSETRNYFWFDKVTDSDIGDTPWMKIGSNVLSADASAAFDVIEIDLSARSAKDAVTISDEMASISDVYAYSPDADEFDYAFARFANKGSLQGVIIYRIKHAEMIGVPVE